MGIFDKLFGPPNVEKLKSKKDVKGLIKALQYGEDWQIRKDAAEAIGDIGDAKAVDPIIQVLNDESLR